MGLPIDRLVLATNENDVLDEFFRTGVYRVRGSADTHETSSPSMDISKASNFERFVFDLLGRDGARVKAPVWRAAVASQGRFDLSGDDPAFKDGRRDLRLCQRQAARMPTAWPPSATPGRGLA
jgi:threonine synthase